MKDYVYISLSFLVNKFKSSKNFRSPCIISAYLKFGHPIFQLIFQWAAHVQNQLKHAIQISTKIWFRLGEKNTHTAVAVLDRSILDPFPHPGFCLLAKF